MGQKYLFALALELFEKAFGLKALPKGHALFQPPLAALDNNRSDHVVTETHLAFKAHGKSLDFWPQVGSIFLCSNVKSVRFP